VRGPPNWPVRLRSSNQALNYLLSELERLATSSADQTPTTCPPSASASPDGAPAIGVIREAVGEVETTWAQQLGPARCSRLHGLLLELNQSA
jgi:hypothetical protein